MPNYIGAMSGIDYGARVTDTKATVELKPSSTIHDYRYRTDQAYRADYNFQQATKDQGMEPQYLELDAVTGAVGAVGSALGFGAVYKNLGKMGSKYAEVVDDTAMRKGMFVSPMYPEDRAFTPLWEKE